MTQAERMAAFVARAHYNDLSGSARLELKIRVLDALGCALGAIGGLPILALLAQVEEFGGAELCTYIGGGKTAPDRAAFYNSALVRYLDFNDSYLAPHETCHPSDNIGAVFAAAEYAGKSGRDFLTALAVAYQVQCRMSEVAPVRAKGFDHTVQGAYAVAAGVAKALGLEPHHAAEAIAICGTAFNALRVTRTGRLSNWKGLAYANMSGACTHAVFLAARGITGPLEVIEGNKGFMDAISGPFEIDWSREDLEAVTRTIIKRYNAEIHSQSAIEGALELKSRHAFAAEEIERIDLAIFDVAYNIIGGGEEGGKKDIRTKEQADHSLPYLLAVALLDGEVMPEQYSDERIIREDVQNLLHKVYIEPSAELSQRFPREMPCQLTIRLKNGKRFFIEKLGYEGFLNRPARWDTVVTKFHHLAREQAPRPAREQIVEAVENLDKIPVQRLADLLRRTGVEFGIAGKEALQYGGT